MLRVQVRILMHGLGGLKFARSRRARVVQSRQPYPVEDSCVAQELCHIAGSLLGCGRRIKGEEKRGG